MARQPTREHMENRMVRVCHIRDNGSSHAITLDKRCQIALLHCPNTMGYKQTVCTEYR